MKSLTLLAVLTGASLLVMPASASQVCVTADDLGPAGPYAGGTYPLTPGVSEMTLAMTPMQSATSFPTAPVLRLISQCAAPVAQELILDNSVIRILFTSMEPIKRVTISFCDGATANEISGRFIQSDYIGPALDAHGKMLPGPLDTIVGVEVTQTPAGGNIAADIAFESLQIWQLVFGGSETSVWKICAE